MKGLLLAVVLAAAMPLSAQETAPARVTFHQDRVGLEVPHFTLWVDEHGRGAYHAELAMPKPMPTSVPGDPAEPSAPSPAVDRVITVSPAVAANIFSLARAADRFHVECESKAKNLADMGKKTLSYTGSDGTGECTFNYSEVKTVNSLADLFLGLQMTLEIGRKLDFKRRFDRLGVDEVILQLGGLLEAHQAVDVAMIAPSLRAIAGDTELMQRVRLRAAKMLEQAQQGTN